MSSLARKIEPQDWHPADIKAALAKKGFSLARVARENGYGSKSTSRVLGAPWSQMERIIGKIIGVRPAEIWPSRYDRFGRPFKARAARVGVHTSRITERKAGSNV